MYLIFKNIVNTQNVTCKIFIYFLSLNIAYIEKKIKKYWLYMISQHNFLYL